MSELYGLTTLVGIFLITLGAIKIMELLLFRKVEMKITFNGISYPVRIDYECKPLSKAFFSWNNEEHFMNQIKNNLEFEDMDIHKLSSLMNNPYHNFKLKELERVGIRTVGKFGERNVSGILFTRLKNKEKPQEVIRIRFRFEASIDPDYVAVKKFGEVMGNNTKLEGEFFTKEDIENTLLEIIEKQFPKSNPKVSVSEIEAS
jgi:hypothetical protein